MLRKPFISVIVLVAASTILLLLIIMFSPIRFHRGEKVSSLEKRVAVSLPNGSTPKEVEDFLKANHIAYSNSVPNRSEMIAIVRNTCWSISMECNIQLIFKFDQKGLLANSSVEEVYTAW